MQPASSFHVTLYSAASSQDALKLKAGMEFKTVLPNEIYLAHDDWHVALSCMQYTGQKWGYLSLEERTLYIVYNKPKPFEVVSNLDSGELWIKVANKAEHVTIQNSFYTWSDLKIVLAKAFEALGQSVGNEFALTFDFQKMKISFKKPKQSIYVHMSEALLQLLNINGYEKGFQLYQNVERAPGVDSIEISIREPPALAKVTQIVRFNATHNDALTLEGATEDALSVSFAMGSWPIQSIADYINSTKVKQYCKATIEKVTETLQSNGNIILNGTLRITVNSANIKVYLNGEFKQDMYIKDVGITTGLDTVYKFAIDMDVVPAPKLPVVVTKPAFGSMDCLCKSITNAITEFMGKEIFTFMYSNDMVHVDAPFKSTYKLGIHNDLFKKFAFGFGQARPESEDVFTDMKLLRFPTGKASGGNLNMSNDFVASAGGKSILIETKAIPSFWVYTDIIDEQVVGTTLLPLLRIVPNAAPENQPHIETLEGYYIPVLKKRFQMINIRICNGYSEQLVPFDHDVICVLHFMRKSN